MLVRWRVEGVSVLTACVNKGYSSRLLEQCKGPKSELLSLGSRLILPVLLATI